MNWRGVLFWFAVGVALICLLGVESAYARTETVPAPFNVTVGAITRSVDQGNTIYWGETVDLRKVGGWYNLVYNENDDERLIDISAYQVRIYIDPKFWPVGAYYQYSEYEEGHGNLLAFYVKSSRAPVQVNQTVANFTGVNLSHVIDQSLPFEERRVSDILVARGDPLYYESERITNKTSVWIFGNEYGIYNLSCQNGYVFIPAGKFSELEPGSYKFVAISPGENTISEAQYDAESDTVRSPFYWVEPLNIRGNAAGVSYEKFIPWLRRNSDDVVSVLKLEVQDPMILVDVIDRQHFSIDTLRVGGYTNLMNGSLISVVVDEDRYKEGSIYLQPFKANASAYHYGQMRQWVVSVPFDEPNMTPGWHDIAVRGVHGAFARVGYTVYEMPEGRTPPNQTFKVIGGNIYIPTPTPITITNETVKTVEVVRYEVRTEVEPIDYNTLVSTALVMLLPYAFLLVVALYLARVVIRAYTRGPKREEEVK